MSYDAIYHFAQIHKIIIDNNIKYKQLMFDDSYLKLHNEDIIYDSKKVLNYSLSISKTISLKIIYFYTVVMTLYFYRCREAVQAAKWTNILIFILLRLVLLIT